MGSAKNWRVMRLWKYLLCICSRLPISLYAPPLAYEETLPGVSPRGVCCFITQCDTDFFGQALGVVDVEIDPVSDACTL